MKAISFSTDMVVGRGEEVDEGCEGEDGMGIGLWERYFKSTSSWVSHEHLTFPHPHNLQRSWPIPLIHCNRNTKERGDEVERPTKEHQSPSFSTWSAQAKASLSRRMSPFPFEVHRNSLTANFSGEYNQKKGHNWRGDISGVEGSKPPTSEPTQIQVN